MRLLGLHVPWWYWLIAVLVYVLLRFVADELGAELGEAVLTDPPRWAAELMILGFALFWPLIPIYVVLLYRFGG